MTPHHMDQLFSHLGKYAGYLPNLARGRVGFQAKPNGYKWLEWNAAYITPTLRDCLLSLGPCVSVRVYGALVAFGVGEAGHSSRAGHH